MNLIKLLNRMDTMFMNSKISKTFNPHKLLLNLSEKINLKRNGKYVALSNLGVYYTWKIMKKSYKNNEWSDMESRITWWIIFCIRYPRLFWIYLKKHGEKTDNPSIRIYVNKTENRIIFKFKTGYFLELLTPEKIKLLGSTKSKITKDKNSENVPQFEIANLT